MRRSRCVYDPAAASAEKQLAELAEEVEEAEEFLCVAEGCVQP